MIDLATLPAAFLARRGRAVAIAELEAAAAASSTAIPDTLRALYETGVNELGNVQLFEADLLDQYNSPAQPWAAELAASDNPAEQLLGDVYGDDRLPGFEGTLFFAGDGGGVLAFVDGTNKMARGVGAIFAISPGAGGPEYAELLAPDFDAFMHRALAYFNANGAIDLISLARWRD